MQSLGTFLVAIGLLVGWVGCSMDTSIPTNNGQRVHNLGLLRQQENTLIVGAALFLGGLILAAAGGRSKPQPKPSGKPEKDERACPYCAENIKVAAIKCRFCGSNVSPTAQGEQPPNGPADLPTLLNVVPSEESGHCPNCKEVISLNTKECPRCGALFGEHSAWRVQPLNRQG